jgi:WD40 repeat protein
VERVLDDAGTGHGRLPLVEFVLTRLWDESAAGLMLHADYERLGGVSGALVGYAEQVYEQRLTLGEQHLALRLFAELTRPEPDGGFSLRSARIGELDPRLLPVLHQLAAHRLVVIGRAVDGTEIVDVTHQALIQQWARLTDWLIGDREFRAWQERLRQDVARWEELDRDTGSLLRGGALATAEHWLATRRDDLSEAQHAYIVASSARRTRDVRVWRAVAAVIGALALVVGGLGVAAWRTSAEQQRQLTVQASQLLGEEAQRQLERGDYESALQLALAAWSTDDSTPGAYQALLHQHLAMGMVDRIHSGLWEGELQELVATPDGRTFASIATDLHGTTELTVWTAGEAGTLEPQTVPDADDVLAAALSSDGARLAVADIFGGVRVWSLDARTEPAELRPGHAEAPSRLTPLGLQFSPDGSRLVYGYRYLVDDGDPPDHHTVVSFAVWDVADAEPIREETGREFTTIGFGPDADTLVIADRPTGGDGSMVAESTITGELQRELPADSVVVQLGAGVMICDDSADPVRHRVIDVGTGDDVLTVPSDRRSCGLGGSVLVDATGQYLVDRGASQQVREGSSRFEVLALVDLGDGTRHHTRLPLAGPAAGIPGENLVISQQDGAPTVLAAVVTSAYRLRTAESGPAGVPTATSDDGRYLLEAGPDEVALIDRLTDQVVARRSGPHSFNADLLNGFVVTADGRYLTTGGGNPRRLAVYALPGFELSRNLTVPGPPDQLFNEDGIVSFRACGEAEGFIPRFATPDGGLIVACGSTLSRWILDSGNEPEQQIVLDETGDSELANRVFPRPGQPDQVFVVTDDGTVEVWDVPGGRSLSAMSTGIVRDGTQAPLLASNADGSQIAVGTAAGISVWNVDTREQIHSTVPTPSVRHIIGLGPDDTLLVELDTPSRGTVQIWHLPTRELLAAPVLDANLSGIIWLLSDPLYLLRDDRLTPFRPDARLPELVLDPAAWFSEPCTLADRDFTDDALELLPAGTRVDSPCAQR